MRKTLLLGMVAGAALVLPNLGWTAPGSIRGTVHDFQSYSWNTLEKDPCAVCHTVHNANPDRSIPLWSHKSTDANFTTYSSPTLNATVGQPTGSSRACLSCHDGTVAINNYGGKIAGGSPEFIQPGGLLGTDLGNDHPVSFTYDSTLAQADGFLHDPEVAVVTGAGFNGTRTIKQELLRNGKMECVSCHDVHRQRGESKDDPAKMLVIRGGGRLCLTCHDK